MQKFKVNYKNSDPTLPDFSNTYSFYDVFALNDYLKIQEEKFGAVIVNVEFLDN